MSTFLSRRRFLQDAALLAGTVPAAGLLASPSATASTGLASAGLPKISGPIQYWSRETEGNGMLEPLIRDRLAAFDKLHGTHTTVEFQIFQESVEKTQAALAAGIPPDLGQQGPDVTLDFAAAGDLLPINDVAASLKDKFVPLQKVAFVNYKGVAYGVPWYTETRVIFYHKDLLAQAGVKPPTNWQELMHTAKALTKGEEQFGFLFSPETVSAGQFFIPLSTAAGGNLLDKNGKLTSATGPFKDALQFLADLYKAKVMPHALPTYKGTDTNQLFVLKKAAMYWANGQILQTIKTQYPDLLRTLGAIKTPPRVAGGTSRSFLGGFELFVFKHGKNPQGGKALLEFLFDPAWYASYLQQTGGASLPTTKAVAAQGMYQKDPLLKTLIAQQQTAVRYGGTLVGNAPFLGVAEGQLVYSQPVIDVFTGKRSVDAAVANMFAKLKQLEQEG